MIVIPNQFYEDRAGDLAFIASIGCPFSADPYMQAVGWVIYSNGTIQPLSWAIDGRWCPTETDADLVRPVEFPGTIKPGESVWQPSLHTVN